MAGRAFLLSAVFVSALFAESDLSKVLEETTEIATKTRINADYVPGTVNIISGEELKSLGILNLSQPNALDMIVGMDSSVNALRGSGAVYGGQGVKIKWLLNGRAVSSQLWGGSTWARPTIAFPISTDQIDRIEIIRGPDSAIYGENAIFGVINIITKNGERDISVSGSYQGNDKSGQYISANTFYEKDDLLLNLSVSAYQTDGYSMHITDGGNFYNWVNARHTPGYGPGDLPNGSNGYSVFLDVKYGENSFWVNRLSKKFAQGAFGTWFPTDPLPKDGGLNGKEIYEQFGYGRSFELFGMNGNFKIGYDTTENRISNFLRLGSDFLNSGFDAIRSYEYKEEKRYASLDFTKKIDEHNIMFGVFGQKTENVDDKIYGNYTVNWGPPVTLTQTPFEYKYSLTILENTKRFQQAFFFQDTWDVSDKATVTYGARYDKFDGDIKNGGWSPRIALVYRLDESNILKTQYARAFRPPSFAELSGVLGKIKPETVDTLEVSHIYKMPSSTIKTTLFESRIYDMITFDDYSYDTLNLPKRGTIQGAEIEYKYDADSYKLGFNTALYKTRMESRTSSYGFTYQSGSFPLSPSMMGNAFLTINPNESYPTTFWYHYTGSKPRKSVFTSATNSKYTYLMPSNGDVSPQDYLNVTQQFKNIAKDFDLSIGVQNVFGKTLKTLYLPLNQPNSQDIPYMRQMFWVNLSYKF